MPRQSVNQNSIGLRLLRQHGPEWRRQELARAEAQSDM